MVALCRGACAKAMKSSKYTSTMASGGSDAGPRGGRAVAWNCVTVGQWGSWHSVSMGWGGRLELEQDALAMSATVSVKAQKYGGLYVHPIGRLSGMPMSFSWTPSPGSTTASSNAVEGDSGTR